MLGLFKKIMLYDDRKDKVELLSNDLIKMINSITLQTCNINIDEYYRHKLYLYFQISCSNCTISTISFFIDNNNPITDLNSKYLELPKLYGLKYKYIYDTDSLEKRFISLISSCLHYHQFHNITVVPRDIPEVYELFTSRLYKILFERLKQDNAENKIVEQLTDRHLKNTRSYYNSLILDSLDEKQDLLKETTKRVILENIL